MNLVDELAKLEELRVRGALSDAEFTEAKAAILRQEPAGAESPLGEQLAQQLADLKHQNELAQLDRQWEIERQQYLVRGRFGAMFVPTTFLGTGVMVMGGAWGVIWTIAAVIITSLAPIDGGFVIFKIVFPVFGVLFTVAAIAYGMHITSRATKYSQSFAAYKTRRAQLNPAPDTSANRLSN